MIKLGSHLPENKSNGRRVCVYTSGDSEDTVEPTETLVDNQPDTPPQDQTDSITGVEEEGLADSFAPENENLEGADPPAPGETQQQQHEAHDTPLPV